MDNNIKSIRKFNIILLLLLPFLILVLATSTVLAFMSYTDYAKKQATIYTLSDEGTGYQALSLSTSSGGASLTNAKIYPGYSVDCQTYILVPVADSSSHAFSVTFTITSVSFKSGSNTYTLGEATFSDILSISYRGYYYSGGSHTATGSSTAITFDSNNVSTNALNCKYQSASSSFSKISFVPTITIPYGHDYTDLSQNDIAGNVIDYFDQSITEVDIELLVTFTAIEEEDSQTLP